MRLAPFFVVRTRSASHCRTRFSFQSAMNWKELQRTGGGGRAHISFFGAIKGSGEVRARQGQLRDNAKK